MNRNITGGGHKRTNRISRTVEMIKTVIIIILTLALFVNMSNYLTLVQNVATGGLDEIPWEKLRVFRNGGIIPETGSVNAQHISPVYIAMSYNDEAVCSIYDKAMTDRLFEDYRPILGSALEGTVKEAREELWDECMDSSDYVYMKLAGELPVAVLRVFLSPDYRPEEQEEAAFVSELFLIPTATGQDWFAVLRDNAGKTSILSPPAQNEVLFNNSGIKAYTDKASMVSFSFLGKRAINELGGIYSNNISKITLPGTFPVLGSFTYAPSLRFVSALGFDTGSEELGRVRRLLQVMGYNPEKTKFYSGISGSRTYVDEQGSLRIQDDGAVLYTGEEGIHLSRYLGFDSPSYTFREIVSCADILMDSIYAAIDTSTADSESMAIKLSDISAGSDKKGSEVSSWVTVSFSFYSDGYQLMRDSESGEVLASVTIRDNAVVGLSLRAGTVEKSTGARVRNLSPVYPLTRLEQTGVTGLSSLELCYNLGGADEFISPSWIGKADPAGSAVNGADPAGSAVDGAVSTGDDVNGTSPTGSSSIEWEVEQ